MKIIKKDDMKKNTALFNKDLADHYMEKYLLGAIMATQAVSVKYFSGFDCWLSNWSEEWMGRPGGSKSGMMIFCILPFRGNPILIVPKLLNPFGFSTFCRDARLFGNTPPADNENTLEYIPDSLSASSGRKQKIKIYPDYLEAISAAFKDMNVDNSNIGLELAGLNENTRKIILKRLNKCTFKDCTEIIRLTRMIKTKEEIRLLIKSAEINEIALQKTVKHFKEGVISGDQFKIFKKIVEEHNGELEHFILSTDGYGLNSNKGYIFKKNQFIFLDVGTDYSGYISDTGTTIFIGRPEKKYLEIFKRIYEAINIGLDSIKPGAKCSQINDKMINYLEKYDISYTGTHGHGIGLQPGEYPVIASDALNYTYTNGFEKRDADFCLEENMIINLEIPYYVFGKGSYIIEVSAQVTSDGYKSLISQSRDYPIINY